MARLAFEEKDYGREPGPELWSWHRCAAPVGGRIRLRRLLLGVTQKTLANALG